MQLIYYRCVSNLITFVRQRLVLLEKKMQKSLDRLS